MLKLQGSGSVNLAYIDHLMFSGDNGSVLGYEIRHGFHHRHFMGNAESFPKRDLKGNGLNGWQGETCLWRSHYGQADNHNRNG
jgi:hypothetical protein